MDLPTGIVTFLFTDIEGSSRMWELHPEAMRTAVARHDQLLQAAVIDNNGYVVKMRGDGLHAVFDAVQEAIEAAVAGQQALKAEEWDEAIGPMLVRMGVHSGSAQLRDGDYFGPTVNRAARLQDTGHGGQILLSQVSVGLLGGQFPTGVSLLDLGRHQIKDFPGPERIFQIQAPGLPDRFPPLRVSGGRKTNLSAPTTNFVGREREMKAVEQLLEQGRLVTLTGPGGTGKTRLALQVAAEISDIFRDGVWLVELAPLTAEAMVLPAIAKVFALQPDLRRSLKTVLTDFMHDKNLLLLLDNCEHLIQTCAHLAGELLEGAADLKILASSRESLGVPGEMILRVPSLTLPASDDVFAESLRASEAVQLLAERGRAVRGDFQVTDENAAAVAEICRRLDGIPLAIELAASRLRLFSPQQLASRLTDRFRLLTGGSRTALPRQQTLQALIDWSYELLTNEEQALFRRLSVFAGGWTFEAAEAVGESFDVLELLDQLLNKSLVQADQTVSGIRYGYLQTIRQYARDRLFSGGEGEAARDQHFAYFSDLLTKEVKKIEGPQSDEARLILKPEIENFRQALEWEIALHPAAALDMLVDIVSFLISDSGWGGEFGLLDRKEVRGWLAAAKNSLESCKLNGNGPLHHSWAQYHLLEGQTAIGVGDFNLTRQETTKAITLARELGDQYILMVALGFFAISGSAEQLFDPEYVKAAEECLALARKLNNTYYQGVGFNVLAGYEMQRGNEKAAQAYLAESAKGGNFMSAMANFQSGSGFLHSDADNSRALAYFQESRRQFETIENPFFVAILTSQIAHIQRQNGELDAAEAEYSKSLAEFHWQGHGPAVAHELECLAFIARRKKMPERAARLLGAAEALRQKIAVPMLADEQAEYDMELAALEGAIAPEPFQIAWTAGRNMNIDQAVPFALAGLMT